MNFIDKIKEKAKQNVKTIVLPESQDLRILKACKIIEDEKIANIILIGNKDKINSDLKENNIILKNTKIIDQNSEENKETLEKYANYLKVLREKKGMTYEKALELLKTNSRYYACMMVKENDADGFVSGAMYPTADTLKPALQIIKSRPNDIKTVSAFFIMETKETEFGDNGVLIFADCGMNENPTAEQLSDIAISSSKTFKELIDENEEPRVAFLSYSTKGSAKSDLTLKMINATNLTHEKAPNLLADGELQLDSAIIPEVQKLKAPDSILKGKANILIFPDLNAGNIGYKLVQRFGKANAYGPICQGLSKSVNDLSRGCSVDDIVGVVAITCVQALRNI